MNIEATATGISTSAAMTEVAPQPARQYRLDTLLSLPAKAILVLISRWKLRACEQVGALARVQGQVRIMGAGQITLGDRVRLRGSHVPVELAALPGARLTIGARTFINSGTSICAAHSVTIGENVAIGNYALIMDTDFHTPGDHTRPSAPEAVVIEDDAWIAARATILKGVRIGKGAVVAAGAVVTRDVPPYTMVGGVPARVLRTLDPGVPS